MYAYTCACAHHRTTAVCLEYMYLSQTQARTNSTTNHIKHTDVLQSHKHISMHAHIHMQYAYWITINYREAYNIFASNGILFNHESPLRGETFVTRKITRGVSKIALGLQEILYLGNLDSKRDWGHAKDYVELMWKILQYEKPDDWVIATGETTSIREFLVKAFKYVGIEIYFEGKGVNEKGFVKKSNINSYELPVGKQVIGVDKRYFRPTEVDLLIGDSTKARKKLDWSPKYNIDELISDMMSSDINLFKNK